MRYGWCSLHIAYILVGNNLHILNMTRSLKDLAKNVLGYTLLQASNVQRPLVRLRGCPSEVA